MKKKFFRSIAVITAVLFVGTALVSCKDNQEPTPTPTTSPETSTAPSTKPQKTEYMENGIAYVVDSDISCHIIGAGSFNGTVLEIPDEDSNGRIVSYIDIGAFKGNTTITEVRIGNKIRAINQSAFRDCTALKKVTLPENLDTVGSFAFYGCSSLEEITLPAALTKLGEGNFTKCDKLTKIDVSSDSKSYKSIDGVLYNFDMTTLITYPIGKTAESVIVSEGVKTIGNSSFAYCKYIKTVSLASTVENIADHAFRECPYLATLNLSEALTRIGVGACYNCKELKTVNYPGTKETWEDDEKMNLTDTWARGAGKYTVNYEYKG